MPGKHDIEIGQVFEQSQQNAKQIGDLRTDIRALVEKLDAVVGDVYNQLRKISSPDRMATWTAAGVISVVILTIGGIVASGFQREMTRQDILLERLDARHVEAEKGLDMKLQREQVLITESVNEKIKGLIVANDERHQERVKLFESLYRRVQRLENNRDQDIRGDLEELRKRRMEK
jgi:hypothetical protein